MPTFRRQTSLAIGASTENVFDGSQWEILPQTANMFHLRFGIVADGADVFADLYSGTDLLMENAEISNANRWPIDPDDFDLDDLAAAGERLKLRLRNDSGAAREVRTVLKIMPAG